MVERGVHRRLAITLVEPAALDPQLGQPLGRHGAWRSFATRRALRHPKGKKVERGVHRRLACPQVEPAAMDPRLGQPLGRHGAWRSFA